MIRLEDSITVSRPIEEAFAYVADFETVAEWDPGVQAAERQTPGVEGVGAAYRVVATFRGREIPMTYETVEHDPPHRVVLVGEGANIHARDAITFEAVDATTTRITYQAEFKLRWPWRLLEPFLRGTFRRLGDAGLQGMQRALDGGARAAEAEDSPQADA